jgi:hypothetical protein
MGAELGGKAVQWSSLWVLLPPSPSGFFQLWMNFCLYSITRNHCGNTGFCIALNVLLDHNYWCFSTQNVVEKSLLFLYTVSHSVVETTLKIKWKSKIYGTYKILFTYNSILMMWLVVQVKSH